MNDKLVAIAKFKDLPLTDVFSYIGDVLGNFPSCNLQPEAAVDLVHKLLKRDIEEDDFYASCIKQHNIDIIEIDRIEAGKAKEDKRRRLIERGQ